MNNTWQVWIVIGVISLNCYCFGANCVERFVNYQTWPYIASRSFKTYHKAQSTMIQLFIVAPSAIGVLLQVTLLQFYRSVGASGLLVGAMLLSSLAGGASTVFLQIPIHRRFDAEGYSPELMTRLLSTDRIRKAADVVRIVATILFMKGLLKV